MDMSAFSGRDSTPVEDRLTVDPVTGLHQEYLFRLRLRDEFYRARERETNSSLLAVKLDKIIEINARHGRAGGDEALRSLGALLKNRQASPENAKHLLFKLTGPVFGYYLPDCDSGRAQSTAENIVSHVARSELFTERLTVSVGVVDLYEFFTRDEEPLKIAHLIERTALNRVVTAEK